MALGYEISPEIGFPPTIAIINLVSILIIVWGGALMIASRLKAGAAAKEAQDRAWSTEQRFRVMADGAPAMIWVTNAKGVVEFVNREYCEFLGVTQDEARRDAWRIPVHPDDADGYAKTYAAALANQASFRSRVRVRHATGDWRWVESSASPRFSESGAFLGHVGLSPDITEMVRAQQTLEQADQRKDEFLAMLSHELRNPLAPIRTAADILETASVTPEQLRWASGMIRRQAVRMAGLLDDLFDVARIAEGKLALSLQLASFSSIMDAAIEVAAPALDRKSHRLSVSLPAEPAMLRADPLRLSQVFCNLLTNAAKYTDPGGRIELAAASDGGRLRVSVKDNGIGIPAEALTRVFALFSQMEATNARAEGGMGIGLALAKGIVELHGGAIEAQSRGRGHGSEFIVTLPLTSVRAAAALAPHGQSAANADSRRVLVADDNKDAADSLATLLALAGHEMRVAYDGLAALTAAREFHPEMALLDIDMPGLDGYAVAEALREESWAAQLAIVAITGWGNQQSARRAEEAGFDAHLVKPVDPERIKALLRDRNKPGPSRPRAAADWETHDGHAPNKGAQGGQGVKGGRSSE
jgi:PAS domain S-box-containing protein